MASAKDVYVTQNGKKYHTADCRWVKNRDTIKIDEEEAKKKGYEPCGQCMNGDGVDKVESPAKKDSTAKEVKEKK